MDDIHSCSYYCTRPGCVLAQRDELRDSHGAGNQVPPTAQPAPPPMEQDAMGIAMVQAWDRDGYSGNDDAVHPTFQRGFTAGWLAAQPAAQPVQRLSDERIDFLADRLWEEGHIQSLSKDSARIFARAIEAALQPQGWQPIETAPKSNKTQILTYRHEYGQRRQTARPEKHVGPWFQTSFWSDKFGLFTGWPLNIQPTHWMPLPARPDAS